MAFLKRAALLAAACACLAAGAMAQPLKAWNAHVPDYPISQGLEKFAQEVNERTNGRYKLTNYHSGQLGDVDFAIEQFAFDALDAAVFSVGNLANAEPTLNVLTLPYVFGSREHMYGAVDGAAGERYARLLEDQNMVVLAWYDSGFRSVYTVGKPLRTPADFAGQKLRVPNTDSFVRMMQALKANPTPLPFGDVYTSLQTGVVDGADGSPPSFVSTRHYEAVKFYTLTEHAMLPEVLVVGKHVWDRLSPEDQQHFREAGRASQTLQRQLWQNEEAKAMAVLRDSGVEVIAVDDKDAFVAAMKPVYEALLRTDEEKQLMDEIQAMR